MTFYQFLRSPLGVWRWRRMVKRLLRNAKYDQQQLEQDLYLYRESKAWRRAIFQAEAAWRGIDASQPLAGALRDAQTAIGELLGHYRAMPDSEGEWECAALCRIERSIERVLKQTTAKTG